MLDKKVQIELAKAQQQLNDELEEEKDRIQQDYETKI